MLGFYGWKALMTKVDYSETLSHALGEVLYVNDGMEV